MYPGKQSHLNSPSPKSVQLPLPLKHFVVKIRGKNTLFTVTVTYEKFCLETLKIGEKLIFGHSQGANLQLDVELATDVMFVKFLNSFSRCIDTKAR